MKKNEPSKSRWDAELERRKRESEKRRTGPSDWGPGPNDELAEMGPP